MAIITEGMKYRKKIVDYAIKHNNNAAAARRYHKNRQFVHYWRNKYDGTIESLRKTSTRPHGHPNQHTTKELKLIRHMHQHHGYRGLAHVYRKCMDEGYSRSYDSMCRQIRKMNVYKVKKKAKYTHMKKIEKPEITFPGEKVQVDVKYVPLHCIGFKTPHERYYQITAIDLYSRKRVLQLVNENSTFTTGQFALDLEENFGFKIECIQTDNGREFCNDPEVTQKKSLFETILENRNINYQRTAPYSPWQNGYVERSHREDEEMFYQRRRFKSEAAMYRAFSRYATHTNNICKKVLNFKSPNEVVIEYFKTVA